MNRLVLVIGPAPSEMAIEALMAKLRQEHERVARGLSCTSSEPKRVAKAKEISQRVTAIGIKTQLEAAGVGSLAELVQKVKALKAKEKERNAKTHTLSSAN